MADYNSSYTGAQIDNAVGKASKLPVTATTDAGKTLQVDSSGNIIMLANGTAGQVLTMNSGATAPEWQTPSGGGTQLYKHSIAFGNLPLGINFEIITTKSTAITSATSIANMISQFQDELVAIFVKGSAGEDISVMLDYDAYWDMYIISNGTLTKLTTTRSFTGDFVTAL